jgi:hypothetical protein
MPRVAKIGNFPQEDERRGRRDPVISSIPEDLDAIATSVYRQLKIDHP